MPEFLKLLAPDEARDIFNGFFMPIPQIEEIDSTSGLGRILAEDIWTDEPMPAFPRSTVDGYALCAEDTYSASDSLPVYLALRGEIAMGKQADIAVKPGHCVQIHTGGMLPTGANAVVMVEYTQMIKGDMVEVARATAVGENTIQVGEDLLSGQIAIPAGRRIRAAEIGGLMALGRTRIKVARQPKVGLISSGDEVVPPDHKPVLGQVRDVNAYSLSALVRSAGGIPINYGIAPDQEAVLREKVKKSLEECDVTLITAGSSVSLRDITAQVINHCGDPGVIVHGVNIKPGKPTILGLCDGKAVIGLPGNPVSALVIAMQFVFPIIEALLGLDDEKFQNTITARLAVNVPSQAGREDWIPVRLIRTDSVDGVGIIAEPVFGKSNLIFTLTRANGFIRIAPVSTGLESGQIVEVILMST